MRAAPRDPAPEIHARQNNDGTDDNPKPLYPCGAGMPKEDEIGEEGDQHKEPARGDQDLPQHHGRPYSITRSPTRAAPSIHNLPTGRG